MAYSGNQMNSYRDYTQSSRRKWIFLTVAGIALCGLILAFALGWIKLPGAKIADPRYPQAPTQSLQEDAVIHFVAGGDLNVTDRVVTTGDFSEAFLDVMPILSGADLTALNFEGNIYGEPYGSQHNSAPQVLAQALSDAGVDLLQTANSKSITNGILGLQSTLEGIQAAGMQAVGTYADSGEFEKYQGFVIRDIGGIRVAVTAFTKGMDGRGLPAGSEHCVNLLYTDYNSTYQEVDEAGIKSVLQAIAVEKPDITIALLHWGSEFNDQISKSQKKICKLMAENGVDAIIGSHPHYVQKMGFDEESGIFVAYSLGDFFGDADKAGTNYSVLLDLEITKDAQTGKTTISDFSYVPILQYEAIDGTVKILRIREAMAAYENSYIDAIPKEVYDAMASALTRIEARVEG